jgi:hypothetical protein
MAVVKVDMERNSSLLCLGMTYYYVIVKGCAVRASTAPSTYLPTDKKGNFVPVHTMKAYRGSRGIPPRILNLGTEGTECSALPSEKVPHCSLDRALGGSQSWCGRRRKESLDVARSRTHITLYCALPCCLRYKPCLCPRSVQLDKA